MFRRICLLLIVVVFLVAVAHAARAAGPTTATALDRYVAKPDPSYRWSLVKTVPEDGFTTYVVDMTSQTWRTLDEVDRATWKHWLVVVRPDGVRFDKAMLLLGGGSNRDAPPKQAGSEIRMLALGTKSVVAELRMVPNQPLVFFGDGKQRYEDDLIAYTWDRFIATRDETWPARLPMVKSAVRAMDTIQALLGRQAEPAPLSIKQFVVAGASKRGWTTWLTAAADRRVAAIIPIVIDVLNVRASMRHHRAAYGFWAPAVGDYEHHEITDRIDSPDCDALLEIADPYNYRHRLGLPKYIVNSSGDQYFLPDSSQFYFDDLPGEKYLRYVANTDHSLRGSDAIQGILAYYRAILNGTPRPKFSWGIAADDSIRIRAEDRPQQVYLWQAHAAEARDFRLETLGPAYRRSVLADQGNGRYVAKVPVPEKGWTAFFAELVYRGDGPEPLKFTTAVHVVPDLLPYRDKQASDVAHPAGDGGDRRKSVPAGSAD